LFTFSSDVCFINYKKLISSKYIIKMRVIAICLDALDYNLIENYNLKGFMQKEHGKLEVPFAKRFGHPSSPQVWGSFLQGKMIKDTIYFKEFTNPVLNFLDKKVNLQSIRNVAKKIVKRDQKVKLPNTIFEAIPNSKSIGMPCYNEYQITDDLRKSLHKVFSNKEAEPEFRKLLDYEWKMKEKELLEAMDKDYDLVSGYFYFLDMAQHYFKKEDQEIINIEYYNKALQTVEKVEKKLKKDDLLLILSDHGQKLGQHTDYGFYSINADLKLGSPKIADFFNIFKLWLEGGEKLVQSKIQTRYKELKDRRIDAISNKEMVQRLSNLGYFE